MQTHATLSSYQCMRKACSLQDMPAVGELRSLSGVDAQHDRQVVT